MSDNTDLLANHAHLESVDPIERDETLKAINGLIEATAVVAADRAAEKAGNFGSCSAGRTTR